MTLGESIYFYRRRLGLSQEELAGRVGVSRQAVSKWELNEATPEVTKLVALAEIFGVTTDQLLKGEGAGGTVQPSQNPELSHLSGFLGRMIRRHGWLAGVYIALQGLGVAVVGGLARFAFGRMFRIAIEDLQGFGGSGWSVSGDLPPEAMGQLIEQLGGSPFSGQVLAASGMGKTFMTVATVIMVMGLLVMAGGIVLAAVLYRKGRGKE